MAGSLLPTLTRNSEDPTKALNAMMVARQGIVDSFSGISDIRKNLLAEEDSAAKLKLLQNQDARSQETHDFTKQNRENSIKAVLSGQQQAQDNNPLANDFYDNLYANGTEQGNQKLYESLDGTDSDGDGIMEFNQDKIKALQQASIGSDKEVATRTRDNIYKEALLKGIDPVTAGTLADTEYTRMYGAKATANAAALKEANDLDFSLYESNVDKLFPNAKAGGTNNYISTGGSGGFGGAGTNSVGTSSENVRDVEALKTSLDQMYTGNEGAFGIFSSAPSKDNKDKLAAEFSAAGVTNEQALRAMNLASEGIDNRFFTKDKQLKDLDLNNPEDRKTLVEVAKLAGAGTTNDKQAMSSKGGFGGTGLSDQESRLQTAKDLSLLTDEYNKVKQLRERQYGSGAGTTSQFDTLFGAKEREVELKKQKELDRENYVSEFKKGAASKTITASQLGNVNKALLTSEGGVYTKAYPDGKDGEFSIATGFHLNSKSPREIKDFFSRAGIPESKIAIAINNPGSLELTDEEAINLTQVTNYEYMDRLDNKILSKMGGKRFDELSPQMQAIGHQMMYRGDLGNTSYGKAFKKFIASDDVEGLYNYIERNEKTLPKPIVDRINNNIAMPTTEPLRGLEMTQQAKEDYFKNYTGKTSLFGEQPVKTEPVVTPTTPIKEVVSSEQTSVGQQQGELQEIPGLDKAVEIVKDMYTDFNGSEESKNDKFLREYNLMKQNSLEASGEEVLETPSKSVESRAEELKKMYESFKNKNSSKEGIDITSLPYESKLQYASEFSRLSNGQQMYYGSLDNYIQSKLEENSKK